MTSKKRKDSDDGVLVYSSGPDGARSFGPGGKTVIDQSGSPSLVDVPPAEQTLQVKTETRQHAKVVTVVRGLSLTRASLERLARKLKQRCGAGGTVEGATIILQGNHEATVTSILTELGFVVRR